MTITEFLLARIAEDEAAASDKHTIECGHGMGENTTIPCSCGLPARVLAESAAKRALVGRYEKFYATRRANWMNPNYAGAMEELKWALQALAAVYADHPDYQPEWEL